MAKTIAAISTPPAAGGIGIVRISGEDARKIADGVFKSKSGSILTAKGYTAMYGKVFDGGQFIDEAVALCFRAPKSYTGEDVVEISCHGGTAVMRRVLRAVLNNGAEMAQGGEFTKRAFQNGKMPLTQAEAVMDLVSASSVAAARAAAAAKDGALHRKLEEIKALLINGLAWLSAWADFPEEDIKPVENAELTQRLFVVKEALDYLIDRYDSGRAVREGIDTVIAGRPNVGKSTLMNLLTGHESSIITDLPGTTRDIVSETVWLGDIQLKVSDTAGLRNTADTVESIGVKKARERLSDAQLIIAVFDSSQSLEEDDLELLSQCKGRPAVAVINKSDLARRIDPSRIKEYIGTVITFSASTEKDTRLLERAVSKAAGISKLDPSEAMLANERQLSCAVSAKNELDAAISALSEGYTLDAVTVLLEQALDAILALSGEKITETVTDAVFNNFCVGK